MKRKHLFVIGAILIFALALSQDPKEVIKEGSPPRQPEPSLSAAVVTSLTEDPKLSTLHKVIKVVDGDTVTIEINGIHTTLRLIGMDTPETVDPRKPVQCFGQEASQEAKRLLVGQQVWIESDPSQGELDKYGRKLAYLFLEDGTFFNELMIRTGFAHEYTYQTPYLYQAQFKEAENLAKKEGRGLWSETVCNTAHKTEPTKTQRTLNEGDTYSCSSNVYNCSSFTTEREAQAAFDFCGGTSNDIHKLDQDGDGRVCESLP